MNFLKQDDGSIRYLGDILVTLQCVNVLSRTFAFCVSSQLEWKRPLPKEKPGVSEEQHQRTLHINPLTRVANCRQHSATGEARPHASTKISAEYTLAHC